MNRERLKTRPGLEHLHIISPIFAYSQPASLQRRDSDKSIIDIVYMLRKLSFSADAIAA